MFFNINVDLKISRISLQAFCSASIIFQTVARKSQMLLEKKSRNSLLDQYRFVLLQSWLFDIAIF